MKKHVIISLLSLSLVMTVFSGCGKNEANSAPAAVEETKEATEEAVQEEAADDKAEEAVAETEETEEVQEEVVEEKEEFVSDRSRVFEMFADMNIGWNLGNTFDAKGVKGGIADETYWGNPSTTQEMIDTIAKQGFNAIRIPVTWADHLGAAPDYKIDEEWLDRVQEVVDYAVANDMYIMINTHHEEQEWLDVVPENQDALCQELSSIWAQVAERFKDYNEKLIFEGMNEPRMVGSSKEWNGGTPEERVVINAMNKAFVDTVRNSGGNNGDRVLVICTYGNSPANKALSELEIPEDNNIAVAIHMYTPYTFTYVPTDQPSLEVWDGSKKAEIVNTLKQLDQYLIQKDVPVVITEFGAQNKDNVPEIVKWLDDYVGFMNKYGVKCFWWDNGYYHGNDNERFAIFNRNDLTWYEPAIADELVKLGNQGKAE